MNNDNYYQLNPSDPDYKLEEFWLTFKKSVFNFYFQIGIDMSIIYTWSNHLNKLKSEKNYQQIEENINQYILDYAIDLIKYADTYHGDLFETNVKRWVRVSGSQIVPTNKIFIIFQIFNELRNWDEGIELLEDISIEQVLNLEFEDIIRFAIEYSKPKVLDYLKKIPNYDLISDIGKFYPQVKLPKLISTAKLINLIHKSL